MLKVNRKMNIAQGNRKARRAAERGARRNLPLHTTATEARRRAPAVERAIELISARHYRESERLLREEIATRPDNAEANYLLGLIGDESGQHDGAFEYFRRAVTLEPGNVTYWAALGQCLMAMSQHDAAIIAFGKAIERAPADASLRVNLGWAHFLAGRQDDALAAFRAGLALDPDSSRTHFAIAALHNTMGQREVARDAYAKAADADPTCAGAYFALADLIEEPAGLDALVTRIETVLAKRPLNYDQTAKCHYAIGKARRRQKRHDAAFCAFTAANEQMKTQFHYDRDAQAAYVDALIAAFTPAVFQAQKAAASDSEAPIFLVGMPRSGSTLAEQILTSHPKVADAGEFWKMASIVTTLTSARGTSLKYPADIARIDPVRLRAIADDYLAALLRGQPSGAARITDKLLGNTFNLGLIALLFPNARIVHCRRDPLDTCLSCYFQAFADGVHLAYTFDLGDLGFHYREHERLMAHWRTVLPTPIFDLDYEAMVADQEATSRQLIEHVGLGWDDACLNFHTLNRAVRTASYAQVRQPVYASSVAAWRPYAAHLGPLKAALGLS